MKVLSLFDGMSCGRIALDQLGISLETYYASEIDKYAMQVSQNNYPDIIQLGDVLTWKEWDIDWASIDLVTGGFPCQAWSLAGKQLGDKDERGKMFWVMLDIMQNVLKHNPNAYYLMENVRMKKEFEEYITTHAENALPNVHKYKINSALVSAQNRVRYYWTNIPGIQQPEDKGIVLRDILDIETNENYIETHNTPKQVGVAVDIKGHDQIKRVYSPEGKSPTVTTCGGGHREPKVAVSSKRHEIIEKNLGDRITDDTLLIGSSQKNAYLGKDKSSSLTEAMGKGGGHVPMVRGGAFRGRAYDKDGKRMDKDGVSVANKTKQMLELRQDSKSNAITTVGKDSIVVENLPNKSQTIKSQYYKSSRANFERQGTFHATGVQQEDLTWRKLTPLECERLQTVPDNYTNHVSNTQRYKMLGNGWTVEVIKHIYKNMDIT